MTDKKDLIQYTIKNTEDGSVLVLTTKDAELLDAIHGLSVKPAHRPLSKIEAAVLPFKTHR